MVAKNKAFLRKNTGTWYTSSSIGTFFMEPYLKELNEQQRIAAKTIDGPLLIVAGAGAGKTKTIAHRILHLVKSGIVPNRILAITFTNKAAGEMATRIRTLLGEKSEPFGSENRTFGPTVATFHSLGVRLLREFGGEIGIPRGFVIFDRDDSKKAIRIALETLSIDPKRYEPGKLLSIISRAKGDGKTAEGFTKNVQSQFADVAASIWRFYEDELKKEGALDFDDLLVKTSMLLKEKPVVRELLHTRWHYLHIDEYQDTNKIQYEIAKSLVGPHQNICVVGDGDQSIYGWRGADIQNILTFEEDYPSAAIVLLEQNYRSTKNVLAAASHIIEKNKFRKEKKLFTENAAGEKIGLFVAYDEEDEAAFVAQKAAAFVAAGKKPEEIAVLYRANFQSRALEQAFLEAKVPYQLIGTKFFERKEVKDALSYLRLAFLGERGSDLRRVLNTPARGLGKVALLTIIEGKEKELPLLGQKRLADFREILTRIKERGETVKTSEAVKYALEASGLFNLFAKGKGEDVERLENLRELVTVAGHYDSYPNPEGLIRLIEDAALSSDQDEIKEDGGGVKLMTVHAAKGLEFDVVFVVGLEEGLFPHDNGMKSEEEREEERRLAYVAITRAKKKLILTYAGVRTIFGLRNPTIPSQFISDIDETLLEAEESSGGFKTIYM